MSKKVLVVGGTGAMGSYLVPKLLEEGYSVDAFTADPAVSDNKNLRYIRKNAMDKSVITEVLKNRYDGIIDFMIYNTETFPEYAKIYLDNTEHYIYLSTYRVFADEEHPIIESSPQLLQVSKDKDLLNSDDYCIHKAKGELFLKNSNYKNWTIIRPAITYSHKRCQLITYERRHILPYLKSGKPIPLFSEALSVQGTMSWAGDVAEMEKRLLFNEKALCDDFNVTTSEHHTWGEIADYYKDLFGLEYVPCDEMTYYYAGGDYNPASRLAVTWQLWYDRMFNRVMDNTKILKTVGMEQKDLTTLYDGLKLERETILKD